MKFKRYLKLSVNKLLNDVHANGPISHTRLNKDSMKENYCNESINLNFSKSIVLPEGLLCVVHTLTRVICIFLL